MLKLTQLIGFGSGGGYAANAVDYGTSAYLSRASDLAGNSDGRTGILSVWLRIDGGDGNSLYILANGNSGGSEKVAITRRNTGELDLLLNGASGSLEFATSGTYNSSASWVHLLASWDANFGAGSKLKNLYVNGSSDLGTVSDSSSAFDIDYTVAEWYVAARGSSAIRFDGAIAELYFAPNQYLDLTVQSNREKFITGGKPVYLGNDGSLPTGTAPLIYLPNPAATVNVNAGTGGNFTINGSPAAASTSPSD
jgi:hypothetical protein